MKLIATTFLLTLGMVFLALPSKVEKTWEIKQITQYKPDSIIPDTFCSDTTVLEKIELPKFNLIGLKSRLPLPLMDTLEEKQIRQVIDSCYKTNHPELYLYGSKDCSGRLDCSGFVKCLLSSFGIELPHGSYVMREHVIIVPEEASKPGDLVFWKNEGKVHHVGVIVRGGDNPTFVDINPCLGITERPLVKAYKEADVIEVGRIRESINIPHDLSDSFLRRDFFTYCLYHAGHNKNDWPYHMIVVINQSNNVGGWEAWKEYRKKSSKRNSIRDDYYKLNDVTKLVEDNFEELNNIFDKVIQGHYGPNNIYFFEGKRLEYKAPHHLQKNEVIPYEKSIEKNKNFDSHYFLKF